MRQKLKGAFKNFIEKVGPSNFFFITFLLTIDT